MNSNKELSWDELNHSYQPSDFSFQTTDEVEEIDELLGQECAIEAIKRGLRIKGKGYNLYICNAHNRKIDEVIKREVAQVAKIKATPLATGYVYNFHCPEEPLFVQLQAKDAYQFKDDLEEFKIFLKSDLPLLLETEEIEKKQNDTVQEFEMLKENYYLAIEEEAEAHHVLPKRTNEGMQFAPLDDAGETISKKEFLLLSIDKQNELMQGVLQVQEYADEVMQKLAEKEEEYSRIYEEIAQEVALKEIGAVMKKLIEKYEVYPEIESYLNDVAEDVLEHLEIIAQSPSEQIEDKKEMAALLMDSRLDKILKNYEFNGIVIPESEGAPVIDDYDYPGHNLNGKWLLDAEGTTVSSDYKQIRPGLFHYANGGYLILHIEELLEKNNGWNILKRMLRTGKIRIEGNEELGLALTRNLKPQDIKIDVKVILVGSRAVYEVLSGYDEEFKNFFKIKVEFKDDIECDKLQIEKFAGMIKNIVRQEGLLPVSTAALLKLVELGNRKADHPKRIPADTEALMDIIREAQDYAQGQIEVKDIEACMEARQCYEHYLQERLDESINDATYLLDTKGARIGQVNGLAVYNVGEVTFGRPLRITATTYRGKQGIVDIENEAKLSGAIHTKGIHIISGFLGNQFAQEFPLSLSCNICFEQSYAPIDGDSASSTELYAILSSLAEFPIIQSIAVTGSVNQFGEIQPIGGVNEKIEGFYKVCKRRGLTGDEGVLIPKQNIKELILEPEIIEAVKNQQFHIYAIGDIWEGVQILMHASKEQVILKVKEKLKKYNE